MEEFNTRVTRLETQHIEAIKKVKLEYEEMIDRIKAKHKKELADLKEINAIEKETWYEKQEGKLKERLDNELAKIQKKQEKEKNEQIDLIINKLGEEKVGYSNQVKQEYS